jgi:hypothetical protein
MLAAVVHHASRQVCRGGVACTPLFLCCRPRQRWRRGQRPWPHCHGSPASGDRGWLRPPAAALVAPTLDFTQAVQREQHRAAMTRLCRRHLATPGGQRHTVRRAAATAVAPYAHFALHAPPSAPTLCAAALAADLCVRPCRCGCGDDVGVRSCPAQHTSRRELINPISKSHLITPTCAGR